MPVVKLTTKVRYNSKFQGELDKLIEELQVGNKRITASILVKPGYEYWWFLEYGTSPRGWKGPQKSDPVVLAAPAALARKKPKYHSRPYLIEPRVGLLPRRVTGRAIVRKQLVFFSRSGKKQRRFATYHPGIAPVSPRGVIRMAIFRAQQQMVRRLSKLFTDEDTIEREDVVDIVNESMRSALAEIRAGFPPDQNPKNRRRSHEARPRPSAHLSTAFSLKPAE